MELEQMFDRMGTAPNRERKLSPGPDHPNHLTDWRATVNGTRICSVEGCALVTTRKSMCSKHAMRVYRHGDPDATKRPGHMFGASVEDRLARYSKSDGECLVWTGSKGPHGHGRINVKGKYLATHRAAWSVVHGDIPDGLVVRHKCDNPPCVLLSHLELGTTADNARDMLLRGRSNSPLTPDQVREIGQLILAGVRTKQIAEQYGVHPSSISHMRSGRTWSAVLGEIL